MALLQDECWNPQPCRHVQIFSDTGLEVESALTVSALTTCLPEVLPARLFGLGSGIGAGKFGATLLAELDSGRMACIMVWTVLLACVGTGLMSIHFAGVWHVEFRVEGLEVVDCKISSLAPVRSSCGTAERSNLRIESGGGGS